MNITVIAEMAAAGDPEEIKSWARERLRSSKTPDDIVLRAELPKTDTGKPLRRVLPAGLDTTLESTSA
ncbi:AMP-binding enzyme [Actinomadura physcomitrii]|nr:hypothetical protein [Actinomadura physcomitrii]